MARALRYADVHRLISVAQAYLGRRPPNMPVDDTPWEAGYGRDPAYFDGWEVDCPNCGGTRTLKMRLQAPEGVEWQELQDWYDEEWLTKAVLVVGCSRSCRPPWELVELLDDDPEVIRKRVDRQILDTQAARIVELERDLRMALVHLSREQEIADRLARKLVTDGRISSPGGGSPTPALDPPR